MNKRIQLQIRKPLCDLCPISQFTEPGNICITGDGPSPARVMVVTKIPQSPKYREMVEEMLRRAGLADEDIYFTAAVKCRCFERQPSRKNVRTCSNAYLDQEIDLVEPEWILALGNEAMNGLVGKSGITKYRGQIFDHTSGAKVVPTLSPGMVIRKPGYERGWQADFEFFAANVKGEIEDVLDELPEIQYVTSKADLKAMVADLEAAEVMSYDVETNGFNEFDEGAQIVSLAVTLRVPKRRSPVIWAVPLAHPQSVLGSNWERVLSILDPYMSAVPKQVAHNGKFDARWLRQFGVGVRVTFDTMIAAHLLDENRSKGLKNLARTLLGAPAWDISTKNLADTPIDKVLEYNALDTYYTYLLYERFKEELAKQPRLLRLLVLLLMPAGEVLTQAEMRGIWVDPEKLATNTHRAYATLAEIEERLMEWVPEELPEDLPTNKRTGTQVNFNPSNFARWWLFDYLGLPVVRRGKPKDDGTPGDPSMAEDVLLELQGQHDCVELLLERSKWQKYCSAFFDPYNELVDAENRIHTTFKLFGTVTGRLSSGKVDADKVTGKANIRGVNLQQVPRDPFVRSLFGAPEDWYFVEADFSQIELRVVAYISRDPTMIRLYQEGADIHTATASWVMGIPASKVTKEQRKYGKAFNFGLVYGMGAKKFQETAFLKYGLRMSLDECQASRSTFFEKYDGLPKWHAKQRRLAHKYGRVVSPLGRIRHLPDVYSEDRGVANEAERQAINSPVQSFASDMTVLSMVLIHKTMESKGLRCKVVGTVHDSILFEVHRDDAGDVLPLIKDQMEDLPLERKFGVSVDVPIVADIGVGKNWGQAVELTPEQVYNFTPALVGE